MLDIGDKEVDDRRRREIVRIGQDKEVPLRIGYLTGYEENELLG